MRVQEGDLEVRVQCLILQKGKAKPKDQETEKSQSQPENPVLLFLFAQEVWPDGMVEKNQT